jgi:hypothetical protein
MEERKKKKQATVKPRMADDLKELIFWVVILGALAVWCIKNIK